MRTHAGILLIRKPHVKQACMVAVQEINEIYALFFQGTNAVPRGRFQDAPQTIFVPAGIDGELRFTDENTKAVRTSDGANIVLRLMSAATYGDHILAGGVGKEQFVLQWRHSQMRILLEAVVNVSKITVLHERLLHTEMTTRAVRVVSVYGQLTYASVPGRRMEPGYCYYPGIGKNDSLLDEMQYTEQRRREMEDDWADIPF